MLPAAPSLPTAHSPLPASPQTATSLAGNLLCRVISNRLLMGLFRVPMEGGAGFDPCPVNPRSPPAMSFHVGEACAAMVTKLLTSIC